MNKLNARVFQNVIKLGIRHMPLKMPEVIEETAASSNCRPR
ncbi:MAG: hypothetical protein ACLTK0_01850 [Anaerovoracaceae bacterium]